jgi:ribosomal protein L7/L12
MHLGKKNDEVVVTRTTGSKALIMTDAGVNKATVMATLRQITGLDYNSAKNVVEHIPSKFLVNVSEKEADLTKKALEFVGAKIEIK